MTTIAIIGAMDEEVAHIAASLDDQHFFALPSGTDYADAVDFMTGHLEARGNVEPGFGASAGSFFFQAVISGWKSRQCGQP